LDVPLLELVALLQLLVFSATDSIEIAAGVTPGILEAWPRVSGRFRINFSRTSVVKPLIKT
jgi:hypothetical protein